NRRWSSLQERACGLLASSRLTSAFDVAAEPAPLRERHGPTINGMRLLLSRRLVEAGGPFVTVFWKEHEAIAGKCKSAGGWDQNGKNSPRVKNNPPPRFDRAFSALVEDLAARGPLDRMLLLVTSEMGRTSRIGDPRSGGASAATTGRFA